MLSVPYLICSVGVLPPLRGSPTDLAEVTGINTGILVGDLISQRYNVSLRARVLLPSTHCSCANGIPSAQHQKRQNKEENALF